MKRLLCLLCSGLIGAPSLAFAIEKAKPLTLTIMVEAAVPEKSEEGFVDSHNLWQIDSVKDFREAIKKNPCWHPTKKAREAMPTLADVCLILVDAGSPDVTITVVSRGD